MREIVIDTETTGLSPDEDRIIEIACVEIVDLIPTGREFHAYINPQREVSKGAERVHGLNYEFLKRKPTFKRIVDRFRDFIQDDPLVAHNAPFDFSFLNAELRRLDDPLLANPMVDTLALARQVKPGGRHTLDAMCNHYGIDLSKRTKHGALIDTRILAELYLEMKGGRQQGLSLVVNKVAEEEKRVVYPTRDLPALLTQEEIDGHRAYIEERLGPKAIWHRYTSDPKSNADAA